VARCVSPPWRPLALVKIIDHSSLLARAVPVGHHCLNFVNTVDGAPNDLLNDRSSDYSAFINWAEEATLLERAQVRKLSGSLGCTHDNDDV
jgi:hypothetical protein